MTPRRAARSAPRLRWRARRGVVLHRMWQDGTEFRFTRADTAAAYPRLFVGLFERHYDEIEEFREEMEDQGIPISLGGRDLKTRWHGLASKRLPIV